MRTSGLVVVDFEGRSSAGTISVPGLMASDIMVECFQLPTGIRSAAWFYPEAAVDGEIQQLNNSDKSGIFFRAAFVRV